MRTGRAAHAASRALQAFVAGIFGYGVLTRNPSLVVNGLLGLAVTFLPGFLERDLRVPLGPWLTLWVTAAVFLHSVGMLGLYEAVWWYDHLTHVVSAALAAGSGYATVRAIDLHYDEVYLPPRFLFVFVLLFTLAFGVLWEVGEFVARLWAIRTGRTAVLVIYGIEDTMLDLVFDAVGAVLVALFGTPWFEGVVQAVRGRLAGPAGADGTGRE